jgi:DNA-binding NarL/FixJ family response regulator
MLVLSMHEESHYAERALRAGARGYIMKRESTSKVIAALRQVLAGKLYVSDAIAAAMATQFIQGKATELLREAVRWYESTHKG